MPPIATLEFEAELVREYSAIPAVESLGRRRQRMSLYLQDEDHGLIEWEAGEDGEGAAIGLLFEGRRVVDYDGVFELPMQAVKLLEAAGYDPAEASSSIVNPRTNGSSCHGRKTHAMPHRATCGQTSSFHACGAIMETTPRHVMEATPAPCSTQNGASFGATPRQR